MRKTPSRRRRWAFEILEDRTAPAVLTVNGNADTNTSDTALTLREAIALVNATGNASTALGRALSTQEAAQITGAAFGTNDTIQFAGASFPVASLITLGGSELTVSKSVAINGPATGLMLSGNNASRIFNVTAAAATLSLTNLTLKDASATSDGGAILTSGTVNVVGCTFNNNFTTATGGAVCIAPGGVVSMTNTTISGNRANTDGGGIYNLGTLTLINCTVTGNRSDFDNNGSGDGGGIGAAGTESVLNSIVAGNFKGPGTADNDIGVGFINTATNNVIGSNPTGGGVQNGVNGNFVGVNGVGTRPIATILAPGLANNGGNVLTHALVTGSVALNAGLNSWIPAGVTTDQRGVPFTRTSGVVDIGAYESQALSLVVDLATDEDDGIYAAGDLSLREAVKLANANPGADAIGFAKSLTGSTLNLTQGRLTVTGSLAVTGPGADQLSISGNNASQIFYIDGQTVGTVTITIQDVTLTNGRAAGGAAILDGYDSALFGGALLNNRATVNLNRVAVTNNTAPNGNGGGLYNWTGGSVMNLVGCTVSGNSVTGGFGTGGGLFNFDSTVTIVNSTFSGNAAIGAGGGLFTQNGTLAVTNSTLTGNRADSDGNATGSGGGLATAFGTNTLKNTIVAGNFVGVASTANDLAGTFSATSSNNLIGDASTAGGLTNGTNGNLVGNAGTGTRAIDTILNTTLANNGGPTKTHALVAGSVALDAGSNAAATSAGLTTDQRSLARVVGGTVDIGAFERSQLAGPYVVDTLADVSDGNYSAGNLSLREAIALANELAGTDTITFAPALTAGGPATILLASPLVVTSSLNVNGPGALLLTISGNDKVRVFTVNDENNAVQQLVTLSNLTITKGYDATDSGGGISSNEDLTLNNVVVSASYGGGLANFSPGAMTVNASVVTGNTAIGFGGGIWSSSTRAVTVTNSQVTSNVAAGGGGGGIYAVSGGTLTVTGSTISGNAAETYGGGVVARNTSALVLSNSTVSNNTAKTYGGGIVVEGASSTIDRSTVSGNSVGSGGTFGGGIANFNTLAVTNSTISGNTSGNNSGGIAHVNGTLTIVNSTISGNSANQNGGGINNDAALTITNSTFVGNRADADGVGGGLGGGIRTNTAGSGTTTLKNTIVAGNLVGTGTTANDLDGNLVAASSNNLIGDAGSAGGLTNATNGNLVGNAGTGTRPIATILNPILANNGGPTQTHALAVGSVAINAGNNANVPGGTTTDQRGGIYSRTLGGTTDIGAVEFDPARVVANQILGRAADGSWWYTVGAPGSATSVPGPVWSNTITWVDVTSVDLTGDGLHEIIGRVKESGEWWVSSPNSAGVFTTTKWSTWAPTVTWVDVRFSDLDADGRADLIARVKESGEWWVGKSTGSGFVNQLWDTWAASVTWVDVNVVDLNADGRGDLIARVKESGEWWVTTSNGTVKGPTTKWASWSATVTWVDVKTGDLDGDGRTDLIVRVKESGEWWAGLSTGTAFTTVKWVTWSPLVTWVDVRLADLTGDGRVDLIARVLESAEWWVTQTTAAPAAAVAGTTSRWADWSETVTWKEVVVADFNGDGKQDLAARELSGGDWWVNVTNATNTGFVVSLFADWANIPWFDIQATRLRP